MAPNNPLRLLASLLAITAPLLAQGDPSPTTKVVAFDMGGMWPVFVSRHDDSSVVLHGNPWLGGGTKELSTGAVADIARLDATQAGDAERIALVGAAGLTLVECDHVTGEVHSTVVQDPALLDATRVRAVRFGAHHLLSVRGADGMTLRSYRSTGPLLAAFTATQTVVEYLPFLHDNGSGRLLVVTADSLTCRLLGGARKWSLPGVHGALVPWPGPGPIKAAWLFQTPVEATWHIATLGDDGPIEVDDVSTSFAPGEQIVACFAVDADDDGDQDWLMKTTTGVSILWNDGSDRFEEAVEQVAENVTVAGGCVPDVVRTHGGDRLHLVDDHSSSGVTWSNLPFANELQTLSGIVLHRGGVLAEPPPSATTEIEFEVAIASDWLQPFSRPNTTTYLQVVAWRQDASGQPRLDVAESNVLFELIAPASTQQTTYWPLSVDLAPSVVHSMHGGWQHPQDRDAHYWLTVRLVMAHANTTSPIAVSEPVTIGLTCAPGPISNGNDVLLQAAHLSDPNELPSITVPFDPEVSNGGGVVGVIVRVNLPPPPPAQIPAPRDAEDRKQSQGHTGSAGGGSGGN